MPAGGARIGSGRKSKAEELKLIEKLTPMESEALEALQKGVKKGDFNFLKLYFEYYFGKPSETLALEHSGEVENRVILDAGKLSESTIRELLNSRRRETSGD
jgi:hypothetical protein